MAKIETNLVDTEAEGGEVDGLKNKADIRWILSCTDYLDDDALVGWVRHAFRRSMRDPSDFKEIFVEHFPGPERIVTATFRYDTPEWQNVLQIAADLQEIRLRAEPGFGIVIEEDTYTGDDDAR